MAKKIDIRDSGTEWQGLWYDESLHGYNSTVFNIKDLRDYKGNFKIIARKNRFYKKGTNRPNMVFKIVGTDYTDPKEVELAESKAKINEKYDTWIRLEDAIRIGRGMLDDLYYGYSIDDVMVEIEGFMRNEAESGTLYTFDYEDDEDCEY